MAIGGSTYASYGYDVANRLNTITDSGSLAVTYVYDNSNKLTSRTLPNGISTAYDYDGLNRLTRLRHTTATATLTDNQYGYDNAKRISQMTDLGGAHAYSYDSIDRLTSATYPGTTSESYTYDAVGNRTASHVSSSYTYQPFNKVTSAGGATYTYDNNGNLLTKVVGTDTTQYAWDFENRLKQVTLPNGTVVNYKYDALGRRIQRTTSAGADERYVYDGENVVQDLNSSSSVVTSYLNGPGLDNHLRQTNATTGVSYFLSDHLGSTVGLTDSSANLVEQITYDSFGNHVASGRTRYTYTGRERDADTGLMYYRARFYDPQVGRFINEDPIGLDGGINPYAYVGNNPVSFIDPSGLCPQNPSGNGKALKPCLNININNSSYPGIVDTVEGLIVDTLARAGVGVVFNNPKAVRTDHSYTLNIVTQFPPNVLPIVLKDHPNGAFGITLTKNGRSQNQGWVATDYIDKWLGGFKYPQTFGIAGGVGAHEITHWFLQAGHNASGQGLMREGNSYRSSSDWKFTEEQLRQLKKLCL